MDGPQFYAQVHGRDFRPEGESHAWIQWKGTSVCADIHCTCGHHGHVDADFFYFYRCPACGRKYAVGQVIKLIELTAAELADPHLGGPFVSDEIEDEDDEG